MRNYIDGVKKRLEHHAESQDEKHKELNVNNCGEGGGDYGGLHGLEKVSVCLPVQDFV